jgi:choline dehydrogenase
VLSRSEPQRSEADLHIFGIPGVFKGYVPGYSAEGLATKHHFTWVVLKGHTENRAGTVRLRSADPRQPPEINFRYFADTERGQDVASVRRSSDIADPDLRAVVLAVERVREFQERTQYRLGVTSRLREVWPGPEVDTPGEIAQWVKDEAWGHHAAGTVPIGREGDPRAALDSRFRVRGVRGLRVVDASVFPRIPGTFIVLPVYMMSEKAAETILADVR